MFSSRNRKMLKLHHTGGMEGMQMMQTPDRQEMGTPLMLGQDREAQQAQAEDVDPRDSSAEEVYLRCECD